MQAGVPVRLIDVREQQEHAVCHIEGARLMPMNTVPQYLQELDDEDRAREWIEHPDTAAPWIAGAGVGAYPPVFVGKFFDMMRIDE